MGARCQHQGVHALWGLKSLTHVDIIANVLDKHSQDSAVVNYNMASLWTQHQKVPKAASKQQDGIVKAWADAFWKALQSKATATANALRFMTGAKALKIEAVDRRERVIDWKVCLCSYVAMWLCGYMAMWPCGNVVMWLCGYVANVAMWLF